MNAVTELPESLKNLHESGVELYVVHALLERLPGRMVCAPSPDKLRYGHELVDALGLEMARQIARCVGGPSARFCVPTGHRIRHGDMKRAVVPNSDYESVEAMEQAIDRHFRGRNTYFKENPKRAGNNIWDAQAFEAGDLPGGLYRKM